MRPPLARADADAGAVRDDLPGYVAECLGGAGTAPVAEETGVLDKGAKSVGVARRYTGTAWRIETARVGGSSGPWPSGAAP